MKILVVEDDEFNRLVITEMLNMLFSDLSLDTAQNGIEAYEKLKRNQYDLVISDIDMPKMNGVDLMKKIKYELKLNIPVIALTAFAVIGDRERLLLVGFDDYVSKPIEQNILRQVLEKYIDPKFPVKDERNA